jgi:hypothetical protein
LIDFWALHNGGMNFVSRKVAKEQRRKVLDFEFLVSYLNMAIATQAISNADF